MTIRHWLGWIGLVLVSLGIVVGVVLFLRARNAPIDQNVIFDAASPINAGSPSQAANQEIRPYKPVTDYTPAPAYQPGDPPPTVRSDDIYLPPTPTP